MAFCLLLLSMFAASTANIVRAEEPQVTEIEWVQLIPAEDLEALLNPPDYMDSIQDGSAADTLDTLDEWGKTNEAARRYKQALESQQVVTEFAGQSVRIPGFVVPLATNEEREVTEFFIVPYFGACLHLPPPPPNQIIHGKWPEGLTVESLAAPMWFEGKLAIQTNNNELGTSAYSLNLANIELYEE